MQKRPRHQMYLPLMPKEASTLLRRASSFYIVVTNRKPDTSDGFGDGLVILGTIASIKGQLDRTMHTFVVISSIFLGSGGVNPGQPLDLLHVKVLRPFLELKGANCYVVAYAIVAYAISSLVMARDHLIETVMEIPLVISDVFDGMEKTSTGIKILKQFEAF
ncbi:hypothetical protein V6N12_058006 [Hibiscus sabdariffa]|uniref:H(+)-exporting diphosphatase n=1 Tax=Hibiscus sabdariffa TaxID=183260 RepID=A0ABR2AXP6_9ROSI